MMRIHKRNTNEEFFDVHGVMTALVYFCMIIIFFAFFHYVYPNYLQIRAASRELPWSDYACALCRCKIFLTSYAPDEESYGVTTTEQTSLLQSADDGDNSVIDSTRDHQIECQITHSIGVSVSDYTHPISEPSGSADSENVSILSTQLTVNRITTTDLVFDQPQINSQRYPHPQVPHIVLRESSPEEKDNNIITTTSYGSFYDSPSGSFTTPHAANSLDDSLDGTHDDTNIAARSVIEGVSHMKTDDNGEPIHSALPDGSQQANIHNGTTTDLYTSNELAKFSF
ncbi:unnamed protein product, partial [Rotaria sp. Silwood2]